jgi:radical SAM superfamily enzyme YgiQ (UPF0313 family)
MTLTGLRYEGPIYRPPSEAHSLLIQATIGCPHNQCTFCMVYKNGPRFKIRPTNDIKEDLLWAKNNLGDHIQTIFFPSGNTIIMKTSDLIDILTYSKKLFPNLQRITVYGSSQYIVKKGLEDMKKIAQAGLSRIHVGLETGDDILLQQTKKGTMQKEQIQAGQIINQSGIELSEYVVLGLGGNVRSTEHIQNTIIALNAINPTFIRIRTLLPKINTPLLDDIQKGKFQLLSPHQILHELYDLIQGLSATSHLTSDHYTNYLPINGKLPNDKKKMLKEIEEALKRDENSFRKPYIGSE